MSNGTFQVCGAHYLGSPSIEMVRKNAGMKRIIGDLKVHQTRGAMEAAQVRGDAAARSVEALTDQLDDIATRKFPSSRGGEQRIDVYLELNQLLRVEDTLESVQALQTRLPALLQEFHHDLQHATVNDLLHVCLRTLSYFMYHRTLAATFTDAQVSIFLSDIISLLFSTQDEVRKEATSGIVFRSDCCLC